MSSNAIKVKSGSGKSRSDIFNTFSVEDITTIKTKTVSMAKISSLRVGHGV